MNYSYLAGLIDGDGYIMIYPKEKGSRVQIVISSSSKGFLEQLCNQIGSGGVYKVKEKGSKGKFGIRKKATYNYIISKREDVLEILRGILPHSVEKKEEVKEALKSLGKTPQT